MTEQQENIKEVPISQIKSKVKVKASKKKVSDRRGTVYNIKSKLGEGGQGHVCTTDMPNVLVKVANERNPDKLKARKRHLEWIMRQDLDGLHIARPQEIIETPVNVVGYVMELMDGLEPLELMLEKSFIQLVENGSLEGYRQTGGLKRRLLLLQELARTLSDLHSRGLAYGDLSPSNVFVSESVEYHQLWLIDCDNICVTERLGRDYIFTPGYAAPEIIREVSGVNASTDSWSFAVVALKLLTLCHPFESGFIVEDGDPEEEMKKSSRGELPWIYNKDDDSNGWAESGIPLDLVSTRKIRQLFDDCFSEGVNSPAARPDMAHWADVIDEAITGLHDCTFTDTCGVSFIYNKQHQCSFCDNIQNAEEHLLIRYYVYNTEFEKDASPWIKTPSYQVLNLNQAVDLHLAPMGTTLYRESPKLCTIKLSEGGLVIIPEDECEVELQREHGKSIVISRKQRLNSASRKGSSYALHLKYKGDKNDISHPVWKFTW